MTWFNLQVVSMPTMSRLLFFLLILPQVATTATIRYLLSEGEGDVCPLSQRETSCWLLCTYQQIQRGERRGATLEERNGGVEPVFVFDVMPHDRIQNSESLFAFNHDLLEFDLQMYTFMPPDFSAG